MIEFSGDRADSLKSLTRIIDMSACHITYPVELLLQFFICIIYTELLKTVQVKGLKPAPRKKNCQSNCVITH